MAKKRIVKSERGVTLTEAILFGGEPRTRIGVTYTVCSTRKPEGRSFEKLVDAMHYYNVQVGLGGRREASPRK